MPNRSKYEALRATHPQFERAFRRRCARGDTDWDLVLWIWTRYKMRVSDESVRTWRTKLSNAA